MGDGVGPRHVAIDDAQQAERLSLLFELLVDAGVIAAERAHTNHDNIDNAGRVQTVLRAASCRRLDCTHEARARDIGVFSPTLSYKRVFLRMAIWPAW